MRWLLTVLIVGVLAWPSAARERVALVIGNGAYSHASALKNPVGDATAMAGALERLGFEVVLGTDLDMGQTTGLLHRFARQVREAEVVLFFYAGHGIQVDGENYVLPVDARMTELLDLEFEALAVERVLDQMRRASPDRDGRSQAAKIVLLDACRDNPFHESLARSVEATRSGAHVGRGLAEIRPRGSGGYLIGFATDPGDVAYDGAGAHSPYTAALLAHLETPGLEIRQVMQRVGRAVHGTTGARQQPWTVTSLNDPLYLAPGGGSAATGAFGVASGATGAGAAGTPGGLAEGRAVGGGGGGEGAGRADTDETTLARDRAQWEAAEASGHLDDYRLYLDLNPDGAFAAFARARIARLER
ncbi:MAG: caspase family protein, partial [Pseudomonadota bacterium]